LFVLFLFGHGVICPSIYGYYDSDYPGLLLTKKKTTKNKTKKQRENHIRSGYENCPEFVVDLQRSV
jgi:ferredoxin